MKFIEIECPKCGATLNIDENRKECFCSYCGNKLIIDDGSRKFTHEHTYVYIDKSKEKELEFEKEKIQNRKREDKFDYIVQIISIAAACIAVLTSIISFILIRNTEEMVLLFSFLFIGISTAMGRVLKKKFPIGIIFISIIMIASCIAFLIMINEEEIVLLFSIAMVLVSHAIACIAK